MVKDRKLLEKFNREDKRRNRYSYQQSLRIFEALWQEACSLGILPLKNIVEGVEADFRIARAINYRR
ncbi:MAG TPA: hypothetical protein ENH41_05050 [Candidatus Omnitrophica bacterium]|nr:hypothetical protein [Candidatus Omnitrophota bacterium]